MEKGKLTNAYLRIEAVNKELEEFAYIASHDLKAPLRVIDNASKWLEEDLREHLTGETRDNMNLMRGRIRRMEKLPHTEDFPHEFVVAREQRNGYDHAVRAAGARFVEVGFHEIVAGAGVRRAEAWEYEAAFGPKTAVHTKEQADHSLPYLLAVALLDGDVQPAQLEPRRIEAPDVQGLLRKVTVRPDDGFTARYPREVPSRVTVRLNDGKSYSHEVKSYPGFPTRPFTWDEIGAKFDKLVAGRADDGLAREIKAAVRSLETIQVKDLMKLLGHVTADQRG